MHSNISAKRKNDAVITVCQDNEKKVVNIEGLNNAAERLTGYLSSDIKGKSLDVILADEIKETMDSYLEYEDDSDGLASILRKIRHFKILNKQGRNVEVSLKVFNVISDDIKHPHFELLMRDVTLANKMDELKKQIMEQNSADEVLDVDIGVPNQVSIIKSLELIQTFIKEHHLEASFAVVSLDKLDSYYAIDSGNTANHIIRSVYETIAGTCREGDILGYLGDGRIGVALFDCSSENAKIVLNRIRMMISSKVSNPSESGADAGITVSSGFSAITLDFKIDEMLRKCRTSLMEAQNAGGNRIYAVY